MTPENKIEKSVGMILKETRVSKDISLDDASKYTKIHLNILKSIENDDFAALGTIYAKSFLRLYAEYLGLNKDDVVRRFQALTGDTETVRRPKAASSRTPASGAGPFVPKIGFAGKFLRGINFKLVFGAILALCVVIGLVKIIKAHHKEPVSVVKVPVVRKGVVKKTVVASSLKVPKAAASPAVVAESLKSVGMKRSPSASQTSHATAFRSPEKLVLVVRAKEKSWLQVKADGNIVFSNVLKKTAAETWSANDRIELWMGNAGGLELEFNGRFLGKIGRPGQILKRVVLTKSGLSIQR